MVQAGEQHEERLRRSPTTHRRSRARVRLRPPPPSSPTSTASRSGWWMASTAPSSASPRTFSPRTGYTPRSPRNWRAPRPRGPRRRLRRPELSGLDCFCRVDADAEVAVASSPVAMSSPSSWAYALTILDSSPPYPPTPRSRDLPSRRRPAVPCQVATGSTLRSPRPRLPCCPAPSEVLPRLG